MKINGNDDDVDVASPVANRYSVPAPENEAAAGPAAAEPAPSLLSGC